MILKSLEKLLNFLPKILHILRLLDITKLKEFIFLNNLTVNIYHKKLKRNFMKLSIEIQPILKLLI